MEERKSDVTADRQHDSVKVDEKNRGVIDVSDAGKV